MTIKTRRMGAALAALAVGLGMLTACGSDDEGGDSGEFHVLALLPVSGPIATITKMNVDAMTATANIINEEYGGIDGRKVVIQVEDTALDPAKAVSALQKYLSTGKKPDLLIPGLVSSELLATLPLATQNEIFTAVIGFAGADPDEFPYSFGVVSDYANNGDLLVRELVEKGFETVALLGTESATGHGVDDALRAAAKEHGMTVTGSEFLDPTSVDATASLQKLQQNDPDALVITASGPPVGVMLSGRTKLGWDIPVYCETSCAANPMDQVSDPKDWDGVVLQAYAASIQGSEQQRSEKYTRFYDELVKVAGGKPTVPFSVAVASYDWLWMARGAYESTASDDAADLAKVLEENQVSQELRDEFLGPVEWDYSSKSHVLTHTDADQVFIPVGPTVDGFVVSE